MEYEANMEYEDDCLIVFLSSSPFLIPICPQRHMLELELPACARCCRGEGEEWTDKGEVLQ